MFDMERLYLCNLNDEDLKKLYEVKISNRFAGLEKQDDNMGIDSAEEGVTENISVLGRVYITAN
jgi:hypothetical protein